MKNFIKHFVIFAVYSIGFGVYALIWHLDPYRHVEFIDQCDWKYDVDNYRICLRKAFDDSTNTHSVDVELGKKTITDKFRKIGGGSGAASWYSIPLPDGEPQFQYENKTVSISSGNVMVKYRVPDDFQHWLDPNKTPPSWWSPKGKDQK